jgi:flagellar motor switch protein FliG
MATAAARINRVQDLSGSQRAAILVMYLDPGTVRRMLSHLGSAELEAIGESMAGLEEIAPDVIERVVGDFVKALRDTGMIPRPGREFALDVLPSLIDDHRREHIVRRLRREVSTRFVEFVATRVPETVATVLREEHPQVRAVALLLMGTELAARVMKCMDEQERYDLSLRMARIRSVPTELAEDVEEALYTALREGTRRWNPRGLDVAAQTVGRLQKKAQETLLDQIATTDRRLAGTLRRRMLPFEALAELDDRTLQTMLRHIGRDSLILALAGSEAPVRDRFLSNMSSRAASDMRDEIDLKRPSPAEVRAAKEELVQTALTLADDGVIRLGLDADEEE